MQHEAQQRCQSASPPPSRRSWTSSSSSARPSQLRKAGTTYKGLCPFHGEKTPSFTVTPARETWKCFGCGREGDIFNFVMERDGVDFPTALRSLAGRAGVEMSERTSREDAQRKRLREALEAAIAFYHLVLTDHASAAAARDYLHGRGFTDETISTYQLGWAPDAWDVLLDDADAQAPAHGGGPGGAPAW